MTSHTEFLIGPLTRLFRTNGSFPGLVTRTETPAPSGGALVRRAYYNGHGNIVADSVENPLGESPARTAGTTYEWDLKWDFVTKITTPEFVITQFAYSDTTGNRLWQQPGNLSTYRTEFTYDATSGLLTTVKPPGTTVDSVGYDGVRGNVSHTRTQRGFLTLHYADAIGRDTLIASPITVAAATDSALVRDEGMRRAFVYDLRDRVTQTTTYGPAMSGEQSQTLTVVHQYDAESADTSISQSASPDPKGLNPITNKSVVDALGRVIHAIATDGVMDTTAYDPAGNVIRYRSRRRDGSNVPYTITMQYDALNRLVKRSVPSVTYTQSTPSFSIAQVYGDSAYPRFPTSGTSYVIPAAVDTFAFDPGGNLMLADNQDALVRRTYYPAGWLKTETQKIQTLGRSDTTAHVYVLQHYRDHDGRDTALAVPSQLAGVTGGMIRRDFDASLGGRLNAVTNIHTNVILLGYNTRLELETTNYQNGIRRHVLYDDNANIAADSVLNSDSTGAHRPRTGKLRATTSYDARGKLLSALGAGLFKDTLYAEYSGLGQLSYTSFSERGKFPNQSGSLRFYSSEAPRHDAFGNIVSNTTYSEKATSPGNPLSIGRTTEYSGTTKRLTLDRTTDLTHGGPTEPRAYVYDASGNVTFSNQQGGRAEDRASYYGADERLRAQDFRTRLGGERNVFEEYRYDALGRRVWVRARRSCNVNDADYRLECSLSFVRRVVWDGEQELAEIQMPGQDNAPLMENDVDPPQLAKVDARDPNPYFGYVVYTHGAELDRPLTITRFNYTKWAGTVQQLTTAGPMAFVPLWSVRGEVERILYMTGDSTCFISFCAEADAPGGWYAYDRERYLRRFWTGTLLEDKRDEAETNYRRARTYDPSSGRFTQEDPIGLAGGLNLYGFAGGDPVNYDDPFGLADCSRDKPENCSLGDVGRNILAGMRSVSTPEGGSDTGPGFQVGQLIGLAGFALPGPGMLTASEIAHETQQAAALAGRSWTTQRRTFWKKEASSEGAHERWGDENIERMDRGLAPQIDGQSVELHHTPVPRREGGIRVIPVTPAQHSQIDPYRRHKA